MARFPAANEMELADVEDRPSKMKETVVSDDIRGGGTSRSLVRSLIAHRGVFLIIISAMVFSLWASLAKILTTSLSVFQVVVMTMPFAMASSAVCATLKGLKPPANGAPPYFWLLASGLLVTVKNVTTFWAYAFIDVADVITIGQSSVIIVAILSCFILREPPKLLDIVFGVLAIVGVVVIARPSFIFGSEESMSSSDQKNSLLGIALAMTTALTIAIFYIVTRKQSSLGVHPFISSLSNSSLCCFLTAILCTALGYWKCPTYEELMLTIATGMAYFGGQVTMYLSLSLENATTVSVLFTSKIVFGFIWQFALFYVIPSWTSACGAALVMTACVCTILRKWYSQRENENEDPAV